MKSDLSEHSPAELIGLEEHLTVRSRVGDERLDLWFALSRSGRGVEWDVGFQQSAALRTGNFCERLEVFPFTTQRGWIVARGVRASTSRADAELLVRELVDGVNSSVSPAASSPMDILPPRRQAASRSLIQGAAEILARSFTMGSRTATTGDLTGS